FRASELPPLLQVSRSPLQNPENLPGIFESGLSSQQIPHRLLWPPSPPLPRRKQARAPLFRCRVEVGKSRAPFDQIASDQPRAGTTPSLSGQTSSGETSSALRQRRQDCTSWSDPPAERLRDNVCFDFFAFSCAVQMPGHLL